MTRDRGPRVRDASRLSLYLRRCARYHRRVAVDPLDRSVKIAWQERAGPPPDVKPRRVRPHARPWMPPIARGRSTERIGRPPHRGSATSCLARRAWGGCNRREDSTPVCAGRWRQHVSRAAKCVLVDAASRSRPVTPIRGAIAAPRFHVRRAVSTRTGVQTAETGDFVVLSAFGF